MTRWLAKLFGWTLCGGALCGCAHYTYLDADGNQRTIGWVNMTQPAAGATTPVAANWVRLRTVGFALSSTELGSTLELGYSDNTLAVVRNHSCAFIGQLSNGGVSFKGEDYAYAGNTK